MGVFGIILTVLAGIILLLCLILSVKIRVLFDYSDKVNLKIKWAFIKLDILPAAEKKKKPKPEKPKKQENTEPEAPKEPKAKTTKPNPVKTFLENEGLEGLYNVLYQTCTALGGFFGKILRKIKVEELYLLMTVGTGDAALTAIEYGKISGVIFPMLGYICSHMQVGKYDADISPDFLADKTEGELHAALSFRPIVLTNGVVVLLFNLIFKVLIRLLRGIKQKKPTDANNTDKEMTAANTGSTDN